MKKAMIVLAIAAILTLPLLLTGCATAQAAEPADTQPVAVALLICHSSGRAAPNLSSTAVQQAVSQAVGSYGYICVINVDGDPDVVLEGSCDIDSRYKDADPQKLALDASNRTIQLLTRLQNVKANTPEIDTLSSLRLAVRSLSSAPIGTQKVMVIVDSGLNTCGLMDFRNNLLSGDAETIAAALEEMQAIPDLSGIQIVWQQMGDVTAPQEPLSPRQLSQLKAIWSAIIARGGGTLTIVDAPPLSAESDDTLPEVSTVPLDVEAPIAFEQKAMEEPSFAFDEPVFLRESQVQFVGDSDAFVDPEAAAETVKPIAELMQTNGSLTLLLVGTTAGDGTSEYSISLSASRAAAVKTLLVSLGVEANRIQTIGMGSSDPWHIAGAGLQGEMAAMNRKVVLVNAESEIARVILQDNEGSDYAN